MFAGALQDTDGFLVEADRGTAFFDEIGTLAPAAQGKLLRALETGAFRPVGARLDRRSDFRIVAAANQSLMRSVDAGTFRADLAYRLSGCVIALPPLRARPDDIALLAEHFGSHAKARVIRFAPGALALLVAHPWPGNVRELRLFVERVALLADDPTVTMSDVQAMLTTTAYDRAFPPPRSVQESMSSSVAEGDATERIDEERQRLRHLLDTADWNTKRVCAQLGIHRSTLYRRMARLGIATHRPTPRATVAAHAPLDVTPTE
ncbi:MAG TPA: sigma-54-dependent Fis family transcriptional regulator [Gemmatimonas aurantiaca]|uniref:Fis family transcriptional regulator n=2 Tax=Gemmatimonas aurantiaca TaxID=173480 RepID=C1AD41_GEMAT|nr:sigma 54-interacting transcriptional regulator [Gemmatimonas aurantiaca]BAH40418.1 Fis family transcriptional regulator [Gemmatimonas aurantiaca T-27]HCT56557.1 sigma-54-dependent Fis family transcriptional regulator [Gemmatimonas aurantiaca]